MPSNAPTVSRGSGRAGLGGPRPRKSRRPGQLLAASPLSCGCTGGRCGLPAADSGRGWAWCPFSLQPTGGWEARSREPSLEGPSLPPPPPGGSRGRGSRDRPTRARASPSRPPPLGPPDHGAFSFGPAPPAAIWECRGGGNMAPSRGQCTPEPRLHLPPGPEPGSPTSGPPADSSAPPESSPALCGVRVHLPSPLTTISASGTLTHLTRFLFFLALIIGSSEAYSESQEVGTELIL